MVIAFHKSAKFSVHTILHVANFSDRLKGAGFTALQYKLTNGLIRAGHNVVTFSDRDAARAATPLLSRKVGRRGANRRLLNLVGNLRPDLVLFGHADTIHADTVAAIRERCPGVRLAQWNVDPLFDPDNVDRIRSKIALMDCTFATTAGPLLQALAADGGQVAFLPNAVDASIERGRAFSVPVHDCDVFYAVGSAHFTRRHCGAEIAPTALVQDLRDRLPGLRFLTPGIDCRHLEGTACMVALAGARMGLNISRRNDVHWYSSDRMAHLAGNGVLVAMERASGFDQLFSDDEVAFYDTAEGLVDILDRFGRDDVARRETARRGWVAYHAMFDATRVAQYLVAVVDQRLDPATFDWRAGSVPGVVSARKCA